MVYIASDDDGDVASCPTRLSLSFALGPLYSLFSIHVRKRNSVMMVVVVIVAVVDTCPSNYGSCQADDNCPNPFGRHPAEEAS